MRTRGKRPGISELLRIAPPKLELSSPTNHRSEPSPFQAVGIPTGPKGVQGLQPKTQVRWAGLSPPGEPGIAVREQGGQMHHAVDGAVLGERPFHRGAIAHVAAQERRVLHEGGAAALHDEMARIEERAGETGVDGPDAVMEGDSGGGSTPVRPARADRSCHPGTGVRRR